MSYPEWPSELVQFERSSWQSQLQDPRLKRMSETGPPGYRRRFSRPARIVNLSLVVDASGREVFDHFFEVTCMQGSRLFTMPDPTNDGLVLLTDENALLITAEDELITLSDSWLCAFGDSMPVETIVGDSDFRKSFSVVVMP